MPRQIVTHAAALSASREGTVQKEERVRVLFLAPLPPPFGGVGQVSLSLLESDLCREFRVEVVSLTKQSSERERTFTVGVSSFTFAARVWTRLVAKLFHFRPHIVYLASSYDASYLRNVVLMFTAKLVGVRVVCHFHGRRDGRLFANPGKLLRGVLRSTRLSFDRIIFLSEGLRESLAFVFGNAKSEVVPNFVEAKEYQSPANTAASTNIAANPARLIFIGRLSDDKGIYELLDAVAHLHKDQLSKRGVNAGNSCLHLDLLGAGETEEEERAVRRHAGELGINSIVSFHGVTTGAAKIELMRQASIFVLPSKLEIFPLTLLEAFACGLPVIATTVGAIPEVVRAEENGLLVPPGDAGQLNHALWRIIRDDQLRARMGEANRQLAETVYNKDTAVRKLIEILKSL